MPFPALGGFPLPGNHPLGTFARSTDSRNDSLIILGVVLACVINGDTVSSILEQSTRLAVVVCVLIIVRALAPTLERRAQRTLVE
ncbi:hypothetical protein GCM10010277_44240 [Streptomyces longisporoflavus]|nr:hypothetical protein GCM10010277_44240 [Streptomyces longisporoflavus]